MEIMKIILPLLSFVLIINNLGFSRAEIIQEDISDSGDGNFIRQSINDYSSQDAGFLHSKSKDFYPHRKPRTFWIPIGNIFKKWTKQPALTTAAPSTVSTTAIPTTTPTPPTVADQVALSTHNTKRALHGVPALVFNATLKDIAIRCAQLHARTGDDNSITPPGINPRFYNCDLIDTLVPEATESWYQEDGTNGFGTDAEGIEKAVNFWWSEPGLNFNSPVYGFAYQAKVQIIWKSTTSFACARSTAWDTMTRKHISCIYSPAGNNPTTAPAFQENIQPALK